MTSASPVTAASRGAMGVYRWRTGRTLGLLAGAALLVVCLLSGRQTEPSEDAITIMLVPTETTPLHVVWIDRLPLSVPDGQAATISEVIRI